MKAISFSYVKSNRPMSSVDEIKRRLDIVDVIGAYVKLTRSGRSFKGLSPFQSERTPSFFVFPETQTFKDFSSGEQGDIFSFVMKKEGWTFGEALRELAHRAGVQLEVRTPEQKKSLDYEQRLRDCCAQATEYFYHLFKTAPQAAACRDYVRTQRKLSDDTIDAWQIGYSLMDYQALSNFLLARGYSAKELVDAGLVIENEEGQRYDRFRGRLMIPIRDEKGRTVGFGSRSLDGSEPKYMNSPQTAIFDKGRLLFGLDRARNTIRNERSSVLVEGYMDVIGTHQAGFTNVVAGMGTSLTEDQFRMLKRLARRIVLALDPDAAGERAVLRGIDVARESLERDEGFAFDPRGVIQHESKLDADIRVALVSDGRDPDEIVLDSPDDWQAIVANARPVVEHVIDVILNRHNLAEPKGKSDAVKAVAPVLLDLSDAVQRDSYVQTLSRRVQVSVNAISQAMNDSLRAARQSKRKATNDASHPPTIQSSSLPAFQPSTNPPVLDLEKHLLSILWQRPTLLMDANVALARANLETIGEDDFVNPALAQGFRQISRLAMGQQLTPNDHDDDWLSILADHNVSNDEDELKLREEAVRTALRLREQHLTRDRLSVNMMIEEAKQSGEQDIASRYNLELTRVLTKLLRAQKALLLRSALNVT
jgi:DNA primase